MIKTEGYYYAFKYKLYFIEIKYKIKMKRGIRDGVLFYHIARNFS